MLCCRVNVLQCQITDLQIPDHGSITTVQWIYQLYLVNNRQFSALGFRPGLLSNFPFSIFYISGLFFKPTPSFHIDIGDSLLPLHQRNMRTTSRVLFVCLFAFFLSIEASYLAFMSRLGHMCCPPFYYSLDSPQQISIFFDFHCMKRNIMPSPIYWPKK